MTQTHLDARISHLEQSGKRILITGIGGGVALMALEFAKAVGTEVYVTSGDQQKLERARQRGAVGGVIYKGLT